MMQESVSVAEQEEEITEKLDLSELVQETDGADEIRPEEQAVGKILQMISKCTVNSILAIVFCLLCAGLVSLVVIQQYGTESQNGLASMNYEVVYILAYAVFGVTAFVWGVCWLLNSLSRRQWLNRMIVETKIFYIRIQNGSLSVNQLKNNGTYELFEIPVSEIRDLIPSMKERAVYIEVAEDADVFYRLDNRECTTVPRVFRLEGLFYDTEQFAWMVAQLIQMSGIHFSKEIDNRVTKKWKRKQAFVVTQRIIAVLLLIALAAAAVCIGLIKGWI